MRYPITLALALSVLCVSAQEDGTGAQVASVLMQDSGHARVPRWSGRGGTFVVGQPIEPMTMRAITWEFGDGSLSRILPPRPRRSSDDMMERSVSMAPFREHNGGSPCVAATQGSQNEDRAVEPRPQVVSETGQPVLVTTGLGVCYLKVRMVDPMGRDRSPAVCQHFASGRWALDGKSDPRRPLFITLQDLSTGERWRAGVDL
jgi:hypothetical protein